ncbi:MAG: hypothetical protein KGJ13_07490 [Patescibacteria group bacterium]|nr:hypothetical protein [Patescibacteria group bacterium]
MDGTTEKIEVVTSPQGASCSFIRAGKVIGSVVTPGSLTIDKTKDELDIYCVKKGYKPGTVTEKSGTDKATYGNIAIGGLIGGIVDSASGADDYYDTPVNVILERK